MKTKAKIEKIKYRNLTWINLTRRSKHEINYLKKNFNFHPSDLRDTMPPLQRPKLIEHPHYLFMILLFPDYKKIKKEIVPAELDLFIGPNYIITVHENEFPPLVKLFKQCKEDPKIRADYLAKGVENLLYEILYPLYRYCFPLLTKIGNQIDSVEEKIFAVHEIETIEKILDIKRNIVDFRKTMQNHKNAIEKIIEKHADSVPELHFDLGQLQYLKGLTNDIWDYLETYAQTINALHESHESLATLRLNEIIKTLTIFSVTVLPLTLVASLFSMNIQGLPLIENPYGFLIIMIIMFFSTIGMIYYFKYKKWL